MSTHSKYSHAPLITLNVKGLARLKRSIWHHFSQDIIYFDPTCIPGKLSRGPGGKGRCCESGNENEREWERLRFTEEMKYDGVLALVFTDESEGKNGIPVPKREYAT